MKGSHYRRGRKVATRKSLRKVEQPSPETPVAPVEKRKLPKFGQAALLRARMKPAGISQGDFRELFQPIQPPKAVVGDRKIAMDDNVVQTLNWASASSIFATAASEGMEFLGYPLLSVLAQRAEFRRLSEVIATEMTRKWIKLQASTGEDGADKTDRVDELKKRMSVLNVQALFRYMAEQDGFFGRSHLYIELEDGKDNPKELLTSIGGGNTKMSATKCQKGSLRSLKSVEAVWCYPMQYNSNNPLHDHWYRPETWQVMGQTVHHTRLLTFVGREVPDLLKAAYYFGGLSLTQMARSYVDNWLRARQSTSDLVYNFSTNVLKTDMSAWEMDGGEQLFTRVDMFNAVRSNRGTMVLDKDAEEWDNVAVPLGGLDALQQQALEHICSVVGIPIVKYLGIQPAGLNASSEGEIRVFYDWINAFQEKFFRPHLQTVIWFIMLDLWGEIDEDITFTFEPLFELTAKEMAELRKTDADTGQVLVQGGVLDPSEERKRIAADEDSPYSGLDVEDVPDATPEEAEGLEPGGEPENIEEPEEPVQKKKAA